jgi:deoxycitidine kinase
VGCGAKIEYEEDWIFGTFKSPTMLSRSQIRQGALGFIRSKCLNLCRLRRHSSFPIRSVPAPGFLHSNPTSSHPPPLLVSIEGNIGAGKSTVIDRLKLINPTWVFIEEPVGVWSDLVNEDNESLLEIFYQDRKRWSYTFQNYALLTRFKNIEAAVAQNSVNSQGQGKRQVFVTERCLETDYHVFTKMLHADRSINKLEYELYQQWFAQLKKSATPLSAIIHINTTSEDCVARIAKRGRTGEEGIQIEYLQALHKHQMDWIQAGFVPCLRTNTAGLSAIQAFVTSLA